MAHLDNVKRYYRINLIKLKLTITKLQKFELFAVSNKSK